MNKCFSITVKILVLFLLFTSCNSFKKEKGITEITKNSKPTIKNVNEAKKLYMLSKRRNIDSLHSKMLLQLVEFSYGIKNWGAFHKYRLEHIKTPSLNRYVKTNSIILDYSGAFFSSQNELDSAYYYYYKAYKSYHLLKDSLRAGSMLLNAAIIQKNSRDYIGSETASFKALPYLEAAKNNRTIASTFNNLGIIYMYFEDYENAIKYHTKAYNIRKGLTKKSILELHSLNNIGNVYKEKKQYNKAISFYTKALTNDSILKKHMKIKAMLLDNYAHAQFLNKQFKKLPHLFFEALDIRNTVNDVPGKIMSNLHLGSYYKEIGNNKTAKKHLEKAKKLSQSIQYPRDELEALRILIDIYSDKKALKTTKKIISLHDSLQKTERKVKDQFSRIRYETLEKEKKILEQEQQLQEKEIEINKKTITFLIIIIFVILIIFVTLLFWFKEYKQKQKFKLGFAKYLQKKYKLTSGNLEFWEELIKGQTQEELANTLFLSIDGIKSRRKALFAKIKAIVGNDDKFDKIKAFILYKEELENYKKAIRK